VWGNACTLDVLKEGIRRVSTQVHFEMHVRRFEREHQACIYASLISLVGGSHKHSVTNTDSVTYTDSYMHRLNTSMWRDMRDCCLS